MPEETVTEQAVDVLYSVTVLGVAILLAVALWIMLSRTLLRLSRADAFAANAIRMCRWSGRVSVAFGAVLAALPLTELGTVATARTERALQLLLIAAVAWFLVRLALATEATLLQALPEAEEETSTAARSRGRRTKIIVLRRATSAVVVLLAFGGALLTFPPVRTLGASLLASAGIIGIVVGVAAQSTLANLVAGIQIAITEPISIDDVVVVEGEWGNVEEVNLTHVVIQLWDRRRLVLPTSYFVTTPFVNWSLGSTQHIGSIELHLDHRTPVDALRKEFERLADAHPNWDGDIAVVQVTSSTAETITVRSLVTGPTAWKTWDLRCAIREDLIRWLVNTHPEALPIRRLVQGLSDAEPGEALSVREPDMESDWRSAPAPEDEPAPDPTRTGEWSVQQP